MTNTQKIILGLSIILILIIAFVIGIVIWLKARSRSPVDSTISVAGDDITLLPKSKCYKKIQASPHLKNKFADIGWADATIAIPNNCSNDANVVIFPTSMSKYDKAKNALKGCNEKWPNRECGIYKIGNEYFDEEYLN